MLAHDYIMLAHGDIMFARDISRWHMIISCWHMIYHVEQNKILCAGGLLLISNNEQMRNCHINISMNANIDDCIDTNVMLG